MKPITSALEAREAARKMAEATNEKMAQQKNDISHLLEELQNSDEDEYAAIGAMLALPDDEFSLIAPAFLSEVEKTYMDPNVRMTIAQVANIQGYNREDLKESFDNLYKDIDDTLANALSVQKRDFLKQLINYYYNSVQECEGLSNRVISIPIRLCNNDAKLPAYAHYNDSGMDIFALEDITIAPGETKIIPTGIKVAIPNGYELQVRPKSGRCVKTKLRVANAPGTIDAGYRDEVGVIIENVDSPIHNITVDDEGKVTSIEYGSSYTIGQGEKFAQLVLCAVPKVAWTEMEDINMEGDRGGGYGSTGLK